MPRHIDADQMIADTEAMKQVCEAIEIDGIIKYIEEHIAADVQEVKHGKWIDSDWQGNSTCSCCGYVDAVPTCWGWCPRCGAKMDEKE